MLKIIRFCAILCLVLFYFSTVQAAIFSGRIFLDEAKSDELQATLSAAEANVLINKSYRQKLSRQYHTYPFHFEVQLNKAGLIEFHPNGMHLATFYLAPEDFVYVELHYEKGWKAKLIGTSAYSEENHVLMELQEQFYPYICPESSFMARYEGNHEAFLQELVQTHKDLLAFYETKVASTNLDSNFIKGLWALSHYGFPGGGLYPQYIGVSAKTLFSGSFKEHWYARMDNFMRSMPAYHPSALRALQIKDKRYSYFNSMLTNIFLSTFNSLPNETIALVDTLFSGEYKAYVQAKYILLALKAVDGDSTKILPAVDLKGFLNDCPYPAQVARVEKYFEQFDLIPEGERFGFQFENRKGQQQSLQQFKGKVIYLDLWATWCGPCIEERSYLPALQERFDEQLAIVSVSTDKDIGAWKAYVDKHSEQPSTEWHVSDGYEKLRRAIGLRTIPRYLLIDQNGLLLSRNAPKPNDPALVALIEQLLVPWISE